MNLTAISATSETASKVRLTSLNFLTGVQYLVCMMSEYFIAVDLCVCIRYRCASCLPFRQTRCFGGKDNKSRKHNGPDGIDFSDKKSDMMDKVAGTYVSASVHCIFFICTRIRRNLSSLRSCWFRTRLDFVSRALEFFSSGAQNKNCRRSWLMSRAPVISVAGACVVCSAVYVMERCSSVCAE